MPRRLLACLLLVTLVACGFQLRGEGGRLVMPFASLYLEGAQPESALAANLRHQLVLNGVQLAEAPEQAEVTLSLLAEVPERLILSVGAGGRVSEYRLRYSVSLRLHDAQQRTWTLPGDLVLRRDFSYDDSQVLAKEHEERKLFEAMQADMVQQILRRLYRAHPVTD